MLVEGGPLLGLIAHLDDGHEDLGGGVHVAPRPRLLLQGQQHLDGAHQVPVSRHFLGLGNLSFDKEIYARVPGRYVLLRRLTESIL